MPEVNNNNFENQNALNESNREQQLIDAAMDRFDAASGFDEVATMILNSESDPKRQSDITNLITLMQTYAEKGGEKGRAALNALMKIGGMAKNKDIAQAAMDAHNQAEIASIERAAR